MPNINIRVDYEVYWRFLKIKAQLQTKTNAEALNKLIDLFEEQK